MRNGDLGRSSAPPLKFSLLDYRKAHKKWGANCGPTALAAILGTSLEGVRQLVPDFDKGLYFEEMKAALDKAKRRWWQNERPKYGLVIVNFDGPWPDGSAPGHWLAALDGGKIVLDTFSMEIGGWCSLERWASQCAPRIAKQLNGNGKCWIHTGLEVER